MTDTATIPDNNPYEALTRRLDTLEQEVATLRGQRGKDEERNGDRLATFTDTAKEKLGKVSGASGLPIWAVIIVGLLGLYGAVEIIDELHIFHHIL